MCRWRQVMGSILALREARAHVCNDGAARSASKAAIDVLRNEARVSTPNSDSNEEMSMGDDGPFWSLPPIGWVLSWVGLFTKMLLSCNFLPYIETELVGQGILINLLKVSSCMYHGFIYQISNGGWWLIVPAGHERAEFCRRKERIYKSNKGNMISSNLQDLVGGLVLSTGGSTMDESSLQAIYIYIQRSRMVW